MRRWKFVSIIPFFLVFGGCGKKVEPPKVAEVKGKVTLDGAPVSNGRIVFDGGQGVPAGEFDIKDGGYTGLVQVGSKIVRISAYKDHPPQKGPPKGPGYDTKKEETLPAKYNTASKETCEVKEGVVNEFNFALTTK